MKKAILLTLFVPSLALAHLNADSQSTSNSTAGANNTGNAQSITFEGPSHVDYRGGYNMRSVGSASVSGFSSSFSTDYCGGTVAGGVAGMGFGLSLGAPKVDPSCVLLRTFERTMQAAAATPSPEMAHNLRVSAVEILAAVDPVVRKIFERNGLVEPDTIIRASSSNDTSAQ